MAQVRVEERSGPYTATDVVVVVQPNDSEQLRNILLVQLPQMLDLFIKKNSEYGSGEQSSGTALGSRGQYADIWRKIGKLKIGLWDGNEEQLTTESVDEILRDLIGHCFLALQLRDFERNGENNQNAMNRRIWEAERSAGALQSEMRTVVRRLPEFSDDGISKSDIRTAAALYPLTAQLLAQEDQSGEEPTPERIAKLGDAMILDAMDDPHEGAWDHLSDPYETCQTCSHELHVGPCTRNRCNHDNEYSRLPGDGHAHAWGPMEICGYCGINSEDEKSTDPVMKKKPKI